MSRPRKFKQYDDNLEPYELSYSAINLEYADYLERQYGWDVPDIKERYLGVVKKTFSRTPGERIARY